MVRIVPTPLFNEIINQSEFYFYSPLKKAADVYEIVNQSEFYFYSPLTKAPDVYTNQNGDRPPHSRQSNSLKIFFFFNIQY